MARSRWHCWYCTGAKAFKHPTSKVRCSLCLPAVPAVPACSAAAACVHYVCSNLHCHNLHLQLAVKAGGKLLVAYTDECQVRKKAGYGEHWQWRCVSIKEAAGGVHRRVSGAVFTAYCGHAGGRAGKWHALLIAVRLLSWL